MKNLIIILAVLLAFLGIALFLGKPAKHSKIRSPSAALPGSSSSISQAPAKKSRTIPSAPQPVDQEKAIQTIRQELKAVMDLNQKINSVQTSKSAQLLRIEEQATIHEKILADIQKASANSQTPLPSREALLAQEKLRIIREETLRNKQILEDRSASKASS